MLENFAGRESRFPNKKMGQVLPIFDGRRWSNVRFGGAQVFMR